jgi:hypothetical protein
VHGPSKARREFEALITNESPERAKALRDFFERQTLFESLLADIGNRPAEYERYALQNLKAEIKQGKL